MTEAVFTFNGDCDGVVNRAEPVPGGAAIFSSVGLRHLRDLQSLIEVQEGSSVTGNLTAELRP